MKCVKPFGVLLLSILAYQPLQASNPGGFPRQQLCVAPSEVAAFDSAWIDLPCRELSALEVRAAIPSASPRRGGVKQWTLGWGPGVSMTLQFDFSNCIDGVGSCRASLICSADGTVCDVSKLVDADGGYNSLSVEWRDSLAHISLARKYPKELVALRIPAPSRRIYVTATAPILLQEVIAEAADSTAVPPLTQWTDLGLLEAYLTRSDDPIEGLYSYMDRENNPVVARLGGMYRLALVKNQSAGYDILYMSGAEVNASRWQFGMLKGTLTPTLFVGQYDLIWRDAMGEPITLDCHATVEPGALFKVEFPLLDASIRFSKSPSIR